MKTMQIALMIGAVALTSGCGTMSASRGEFSAGGIVADPVYATAVAGGVTTNQYQAETQRLVATKMVDRGMYPAMQGYGAYGAYGNGLAPIGGHVVANSDYWFYYRNQVGQQQTMPAPPPAVVTVPRGTATVAVPNGQYATQQDLARVEEKADDSLCMHYKAKLKAEGKPITPCPRFEKK